MKTWAISLGLRQQNKGRAIHFVKQNVILFTFYFVKCTEILSLIQFRFAKQSLTKGTEGAP